jgi:hypothetical protein
MATAAQRTMSDLRGHLFDTIEELKKPEGAIDINRADAICKAAGRLIQTAEVEIKFRGLVARQTDANGASAFLTDQRSKDGL